MSAGARQAFVSKLYRDYAPLLRAFMIRHKQSEEDANDIIHDVFARVVRMQDPRCMEDNPKAYLLKAVINMMRDRHRQGCYRQTHLHDPLDDHDMVTRDPSPESQVQWRQALKIVATALKTAGPAVPQVVAMSCLSDATYPEIAQRLGVTPRTVERYMQRARHACAELAAELPLSTVRYQSMA
jgi:RNA polymerase sigma-70 factor (ECF subfamily)